MEKLSKVFDRLSGCFIECAAVKLHSSHVRDAGEFVCELVHHYGCSPHPSGPQSTVVAVCDGYQIFCYATQNSREVLILVVQTTGIRKRELSVRMFIKSYGSRGSGGGGRRNYQQVGSDRGLGVAQNNHNVLAQKRFRLLSIYRNGNFSADA